MEVPESTQRHTNVRLKQIELVLFTLCDESFVFCDWRQKFRPVPGPRLWYDVRSQGLYQVREMRQTLNNTAIALC